MRRFCFRLVLVTAFCVPLGLSQTSADPKTPTFTAKGTAGSENVPSLTIPNVTLKAGETLLVSCNDEGGDATVTWNGISLHQDVGTGGGSGMFHTMIFSLYSATGGTGNIVASHASALDLSINASSVTNLAASPVDKTSAAQGASTSPSSGATTTTTNANEFLWGAIGYASNSTASGAWSDRFTSGGQFTFTGAIGGVEDGYKTVSSTGAYAAAKTGVTNVGWNAVIATYAISPAGGGRR